MAISAALLCLALNIYHEARGEPLEGQIAVAYVTDNRAKRDPKNYCKVVYDRKQFSWTSAPGPVDKKSSSWKEAVAVAKTFKFFEDKTKGATHYHATYVRPYWAGSLKRMVKIGAHIFYKVA